MGSAGRWLARRLLALVSVLATFFVAEVLIELGVLDPGGLATRRLEASPERPFERVRAGRARGEQLVPAFAPSVFIRTNGVPDQGPPLLPLAGVSGAATLFCDESGGQWVEYVADEHGFRNPRGLHQRGRVDVALVGDSYAQGYCVEDGASLAVRMRARGVRALSLGMQGAGPLSELAILSEYALRLRPTAVVWLYYEGNDLRNLRSERASPTLLRYANEANFSQSLPARQPEIDSRLGAWLAERERNPQETRTHVARILTFSNLRTLLGWTRRDPEPDSAFRIVLEQARRRAISAGSDLVFVYLPSIERYARPDPDDDDFRQRGAIRRLVGQLGIRWVDFSAALGSEAEPTAFFAEHGGRHYNAEGYRLLAEHLVGVLGSSGPPASGPGG